MEDSGEGARRKVGWTVGREHAGQRGGSTEDSGKGAWRTAGRTVGREHEGQQGRQWGGQWGGSTEGSGEDSGEGAQRTAGRTAGVRACVLRPVHIHACKLIAQTCSYRASWKRSRVCR